MLTTVVVKGRTGTVSSNKRSRFTLEMLKQVAEENRRRENLNLEVVSHALRRMANNKGRISKEKLVNITDESDLEITGDALMEILDDMGQGKKTMIDCETLAQ